MNQKVGLISFDDVSYSHEENKPILKETSFTIRRGAKLALMGQNGAGKTTLFGLISGMYEPTEGEIHLAPNTTIAISKQVVTPEEKELTMRDFFQTAFEDTVYDIDPKIDEVLEIVNLSPKKEALLEAMKEKKMSEFSGGQQARLLLTRAIIQKTDVLLLDEPTNNLDHAGIEHLTAFIKEYRNTVIVISHDSQFLDSFTHGVLYLNSQSKEIEQYTGTYLSVVNEIKNRVEREKRQNAQLEREIQANKDKANAFANKGGNMRAIAKRMREKVEEHEENKVDVRKEDRTIRTFTIPTQPRVPIDVLHLDSWGVMRDHEIKPIKRNFKLTRGDHVQIVGPNGVGKTTLLETIVKRENSGMTVPADVKIGYYRQDFSNLDFNKTVHETLMAVMAEKFEENMRAAAGSFLIGRDQINSKIGSLSEGQKGLVAFARLVLMEPGLLILDEPTNHINFRHIPVIAQALAKYEGTMIVVSHVPEFVEKIGIDVRLDLGKKTD